MNRVALVLVLALASCGYHLERDHEDDPPPPPPPPASEAAPEATTVAAPEPTTAPATTVAPATTAPTTAPATTTHAPAPSTAPATTTTAAETATPAICESAYRCCQAAVAAMPIGGLVSGCSELHHADASREAYCRQMLDTYRQTITQVGGTVPAACHAH